MAQGFFSCDWGTTHFRLAAIVPGARRAEAETRTSQGVATLAQGPAQELPQRFRSVLAGALQELADRVGSEFAQAPVAISGMASSSIGWQELPYGPLPLPLDGSGLPWRELPSIDSHRLALFSGLASKTDVLRGEETQALGVFHVDAIAPLANGSLLLLPGTHSKHLQIDHCEVCNFQTFMTGELFGVLSQHSLLRHSVGEAPLETGPLVGAMQEAFCEGVDTSQNMPLSAALFRVRTRQVLDGQVAASNRAFLSGVLIGSELAHLTTPGQMGRPLILAAASALEPAYRLALESLGLSQSLSILSPEDQLLLTARGHAVLLGRIGWI